MRLNKIKAVREKREKHKKEKRKKEKKKKNAEVPSLLRYVMPASRSSTR